MPEMTAILHFDLLDPASLDLFLAIMQMFRERNVQLGQPTAKVIETE